MPDKKKQIEKDVDDSLDPILAVLTASLISALTGYLVRAYLQGDQERYTWGITLDWTVTRGYTPPLEEAIAWAQANAAKLVTGMNEESKSILRKIIADGIENKRGIPGLAKDIRTAFTDMSRYRSKMIARTETARALSEGSHQRMKDMGIEYHEWVRMSDFECDICQVNEDAGKIPIDDAFPSGDYGPPAHPNCMCVVSAAREK